ncbi:PTS system beta-glucoside-specific EIIBCA component [compost metagenome]
MDTVKLKGQHFKTHISEGDRVTKGQLLVEFDIGAIKALGYDMTTPIIVTNTAEYSDVKVLGNNRVYTGDSLLEVKL